MKHAADPLPATPEEWVVRMLEASRNGLAFKHPEAFIEWLDALSEPRCMTALATVALDPAVHPKALGRDVDPTAARSWAEFADPNLHLRWMLAGMDGRFYTALLSRLGHPERLRHGVSLAASPQAFMPLPKSIDPPSSVGQWLRLPEPFTATHGRPVGAPQRY